MSTLWVCWLLLFALTKLFEYLWFDLSWSPNSASHDLHCLWISFFVLSSLIDRSICLTYLFLFAEAKKAEVKVATASKRATKKEIVPEMEFAYYNETKQTYKDPIVEGPTSSFLALTLILQTRPCWLLSNKSTHERVSHLTFPSLRQGSFYLT